MKMLLVCGLPALVLIGASACRDGIVTSEAPVELGGGTILHQLECAVEVATAHVTCGHPGAGTGISRAVLGQNQIKMASSNVVSDTVAETFSLDATLQNLLAEPIGTPDGILRTGSKVFYETGPTATAYYAEGDTGTVRVANPDGHGHFTGPEQPYHFYDTILAPSEISAPRRWVLDVPKTVSRFSFTVRVFTQIPSQPVEEGPPDGIPDWVYAPDRISTDLPGMSGTYVRDVVTVLFHPGTSGQARRAAIDAVQGVVVGGVRMPGGDGEYYLRLPDDGTLQPLLNAIDLLAGRPEVIGVGPEFILDDDALAHLRPTDGAGFDSWSLDPDRAAGANWGLELIEAPAAWGCETGTSSTRIAVVDVGFHTDVVGDVRENLRSLRWDYAWPRGDDHGAKVASVIAARGNNATGTTGVMWEAGLDLIGVGTNWVGVPTYSADGTRHIRNTIPQLMAAVASGAPIVNLSMGLEWRRLPDANSPDDHRRVSNHYRRLKGWMLWHAAFGRKPLLVVAAGNAVPIPTASGIDAYWAGFPNLVNDFGDRVIVVGSVEGQGTGSISLFWRSNSGPLVEIAAPGVDVGVLSGINEVEQITGTSFAAPMVAGVAGLLLSFDPRLSARDLKDLLLMGATRRVANPVGGGTIPVLNAYESLRAAAEASGAPLCGNRLWVQEGKVTASRNLLGTRTEALFDAPAGASDLRAMHGGKTIALWAGGVGSQLYRWSNGVWSLDVNADPDSIFALEDPVGRSVRSRSHDRDSVVIGRTTPSSIEVFIRSAEPGPERFIGRLDVPERASSGGNLCHRVRTADTIQAETCLDSVFIGWSNSRVVAWPKLSPRGDGVTVGFGIERNERTLDGDWYPCPGQAEPLKPGHQLCRNTRHQSSYLNSKMYWLPTSGGASGAIPQLMVQDSGVAFWNMGVADGPREFMVQRYGGTSTSSSGWVMETVLRHKQIAWTQNQIPCHIQFRDLRTGAVLQTIADCPSTDPTIAPNRVGGGRAFNAFPAALPELDRSAAYPAHR